MNEKNYTSLELSKRLKALGVEQKSEVYWYEYKDGSSLLLSECKCNADIQAKKNPVFPGNCTGIYSAFLASEVLDLLPASIKNEKTRNLDLLRISKGYSKYFYVEYHTNFEPPLIEIKSETLADALALMLEYCIENKLI